MLNREDRIEQFKNNTMGTIVEGLEENSLAYNFIRDKGNGLPIYLGETSEGKPYFYDLAKVSSTLITGCSGSGKSMTAYLHAVNILAFNSTDDVQVRVMDIKYSRLWGKLEELANVQRCTRGILAELKDIVRVIEARKEILDKFEEYETVKQYRDSGNKELRYLVFIFDESIITLERLRKVNIEEFKEVQKLLMYIAQVGRVYGVHLITVGQQPSSDLLGRNFIPNSTTRIGLMPADANDGEKLFGNFPVEPVKTVGEGNVTNGFIGGVENVKIATLGSKESDIYELFESLKGMEN